MAAAIRANHRVYAWTALEVPFRLLHSVEQLLITAIRKLSE
jgi:hypothetical protein